MYPNPASEKRVNISPKKARMAKTANTSQASQLATTPSLLDFTWTDFDGIDVGSPLNALTSPIIDKIESAPSPAKSPNNNNAPPSHEPNLAISIMLPVPPLRHEVPYG